MKALFVDLDGTLIDSLGQLYHLYEMFLKQFDLVGTQEEFDLLNGLKIEEVVKTIEKRRNLVFDVSKLSALYREGIEKSHYAENPLFPFAREVLAFSKAADLKVYIVTSAKRLLVDKIIEGHQLKPFIDGVITAEGLTHGKPFPDIYLKALKSANVEKDEVLVIEDALNGVNAAKAAGLTVFEFNPKNNDWKKVFEEIKRRGPFFKMISLDESFQVILEPPKERVFTKREEELIETCWEAQKLKSGDKLTNGKRLGFCSFEKNVLKGAFIPYKIVLALNPLSVAVTAITKTKEGALLIAKRSKEVAHFPEFFELAPSGGLDPSCLEGEVLNYKKQIAFELEEEVNISSSFIQKSTPLLLVEDRDLNTVEIVIELVLSEKMGTPSWEYTELHWLEKENVLPFLAKHYEKIVPLSRTLLAVCNS